MCCRVCWRASREPASRGRAEGAQHRVRAWRCSACVWCPWAVGESLGRVYLGRPGLFRPGHTVSLAKGAVEGEMVCVVERWCVLSPVLEGFARAREPRARRGRAALSARMAVFGLCVVSQGCWREGMQFSHCMVGKGAVDGERDRMRCVLLSLLECFARAREPSARPANRAARQPCARVRAVRGLQLVAGGERCAELDGACQSGDVRGGAVHGRWVSSSERPHADCVDGAGPVVVSVGRYTVMPLLPRLQLDGPQLCVARLPSRVLRPLGLGPVQYESLHVPC